MMDFFMDVLKWTGIIVGVIVFLVILWSILSVRNDGKRAAEKRKWLIEKYGDETGNRLANGEVWIGMTTDQVLDALGKPDMFDQKELKKFSREVLKWRAEGKRRIAYQITCDDGIVTAISDRR